MHLTQFLQDSHSTALLQYSVNKYYEISISKTDHCVNKLVNYPSNSHTLILNPIPKFFARRPLYDVKIQITSCYAMSSCFREQSVLALGRGFHHGTFYLGEIFTKTNRLTIGLFPHSRLILKELFKKNWF